MSRPKEGECELLVFDTYRLPVALNQVDLGLVFTLVGKGESMFEKEEEALELV